MAKVAIITRTKDRSLFLERAIKSVYSQSYSDYEHVIVNDGGDKQKVEAIIDSQPQDIKEKIRLFHREKSSGAPDTIFSESVDRVNSEYIAIHDDDDTWHPDFLTCTVKALGSGAEGVVVRVDNVYEKTEDNQIREVKRTAHMPEMKAVSLYEQCLDNQLTALAFVYRRSAYESVGKYDDTLAVLGDWEYGIRFLQKYDVEYIDPGYALAYYHRRPSGDNSFASHDHRTNLVKVLNKYLRQDLDKGELGIGYIMNSLRYEQDLYTRIIKKMLPKGVSKILRKRIRQQ